MKTKMVEKYDVPRRGERRSKNSYQRQRKSKNKERLSREL